MTQPATPARTIVYRALRDGPALDDAFERYWPAYHAWISKDPRRTSAKAARQALHAHMPELVPVHEALLQRWGERAPVARFLTLYNPPPLVRGCTQALWLGEGGPALVRNYDHAPHLTDAIALRADWQGVPTLGMADCLWGLLDGLNAHGLCVALAFGGRPATGEGFAAPIIVRYALQTCATADQAARVIARVPCAMAYTFVCLDAQGRHATVYAAPDRPPRIDHARASTNHQGKVEWPPYAARCRSVERLARVHELLDQPTQSLGALVHAFGTPPLHRTARGKGPGTLYTSVYTPHDGRLSLHWPGAQPPGPMALALDPFAPTTARAWL